MGKEEDENFTVTSGSSDGAKDSQEVERQLEKTCVKLKETEVNIRLFDRMVKNGLATNDVRSFVSKQARLKTTNHKLSFGVMTKAMKCKLVDACSLAREVRKEKKIC